MQVAQQSVNTGPSSPLSHTATHETKEQKNTGVPQYVPEHKKPSFTDTQDLRLQVAEALVFIQDMSPDLSSAELFYFERAIDILNRLVDEDLADQVSFMVRSGVF